MNKPKYCKYERGYWYYRRDTFRKRLRGHIGDPDFLVDWVRAHEEYTNPLSAIHSDRVIIENSFRDLAVQYQKSDSYLGVKESSRRTYKKSLELAIDLLGNEDARNITMPLVIRLRDKYAATPAKANGLVGAIKKVYGWAKARDLVTANPADFRGTDIKDLKLEEHRPWKDEELAIMLEGSPVHIRHVILVCLFTGQRISDVLAIKKADFLDDVLFVRQQKTGKELYIPLHPVFEKIHSDLLGTDSEYLLTTSRGNPWQYRNWGERFRAERSKFNLDASLVTHGLRKNAVHQLLLAGCSHKQVGSITGQTQQTVEYYARQIDQRAMAKDAMKMWEKYTDQEQTKDGKVVNFRKW